MADLHTLRREVGDPGAVVFQRRAAVAAVLGLSSELEHAVRIVGNGLRRHGRRLVGPYRLFGVVRRAAGGAVSCRFLRELAERFRLLLALLGTSPFRGGRPLRLLRSHLPFQGRQILRHGEGLAQKLLLPIKGAEMEHRLLIGRGELQAGGLRFQLLYRDKNRSVLAAVILRSRRRRRISAEILRFAQDDIFFPDKLQPIRGLVQFPGEKISLPRGVVAALRLQGKGRGGLSQGGRRQQADHHQQRQQQAAYSFGGFHARILLCVLAIYDIFVYTFPI